MDLNRRESKETLKQEHCKKFLSEREGFHFIDAHVKKTSLT